MNKSSILIASAAAAASPAYADMQAPPVIVNDDGTTTVERPPVETGDYHQPDLVELNRFDPRLIMDIRYATPDNFARRQVYPSARAFLQRPAAEALKRAHDVLQAQGYGMIIYDGYRPWSVTKIFWDITPQSQKDFVADPARGSKHNRGCAVDLSLYDLKTSRPVEMPTDFDEFTERAYPTYSGGTEASRRHRQILRQAMESAGFKNYEYEWWHFDFPGYEKYRIMNVSFEEAARLHK